MSAVMAQTEPNDSNDNRDELKTKVSLKEFSNDIQTPDNSHVMVNFNHNCDSNNGNDIHNESVENDRQFYGNGDINIGNDNSVDESMEVDDDPLDDTKESVPKIVNINDVKFDFIEDNDTITVFVYVPKCRRESFDVHLSDDKIEVRLKCDDETFVKKRDACVNDLFIWNVELRDKIIANEPKFKISLKKFEIKLTKEKSGLWSGVELQLSKNSERIFPISVWKGDDNGTKEENASQLQSPNVSPIKQAIPLEYQQLNHNDINWDVNDEDVRDDDVNRNKLYRYGFTGLDNLGNTCFMNSVIQCLANTEQFRDYFIDDSFKEDINEENPLGNGGKIAVTFANVLRQLWSRTQRSYAPSQLKFLMSEKVSSQFSGFAQHDAQEFMAFLLDALHEDLNRVKQKPYIAINGDDNDAIENHVPDEQLADDAWKRYRMRDDSIVVDLFQGQYKSKLICPVCQKVSITFDPILFLSVPLPKSHIRHTVYFFPRDESSFSVVKPIRYEFKLPPESKVQQLLDLLMAKTNVTTEFMRSIIAKNGSIEKYLQKNWSLPNSYSEDEDLLIFELCHSQNDEIIEVAITQRYECPKLYGSCANCWAPESDGVKLRRCTKCGRVQYCNQTCQKEHWNDHKKECRSAVPEPIGMPFIITIPKKELTYDKLSDTVMSYALHSVDIINVKKNTDEPNTDDSDCGEKSVTTFILEAYRGHSGSVNIGDRIDPKIDPSALSVALTSTYAYHMDWANHYQASNVEPKQHLEHSYDDSDFTSQYADTFTLDQCLRLFTEKEVLSPQEAWYCPKCKEHREAEKQLSLWRLPQILVIQLKRFSFKNVLWRDKIDKFVTFPIQGLDLTEFYCRTNYDPTFRPVYDLYGVVNHYGGLFGGHYTSYARCNYKHEDLGWRSFDDSRVEPIDDRSLITRNAYILFYRLRESD